MYINNLTDYKPIYEELAATYSFKIWVYYTYKVNEGNLASYY